jgi:beta-lactamase class A
MVALGTAGIQVSQAATLPDSSGSTTSTASPTTSTSTTSVSTASTATPSVAKIATDARYSVAAIDLTTGESVSSGTGAFDTASVVKVDILAALLYQAQQDGRTLTASEQALATAMIEHSDNTAATTLFNEVGGKAGLDALNTTFGLTDTVIGSNGNWGLTQTTAKDQVRLLQIVLGDRSVLTASSKAYAAELMSNVEADQNFGVSAADDADDSALKVGYLQRSQTGLWDVTSVGRIESGGHTYLVAVLSDSNASFASGVQLVDAAAKAAVAALA